jgi:hypothetical protein
VPGAFLFIFTLFWSGLVLMFDVGMAHSLYRQYESRNYPSVTGTITRSEVVSHHSSKDGTSYNAVIEYQFEAGGRKLVGNKIRLGTTASSHANAVAAVNARPVGSTVPVFYNPTNPQESLLSPGIEGLDFMFLLFLTPFNMVMFGFWIWIGGWLREHFFRPVAGGVKIIADGMTTRIRLPQVPAIVWGIGATGGLGFISIFAVGLGAGMEPSIPLILSATAAVYGTGLAVYLWQWRKINSGIDDLIVNGPSQTLELPLTFDRKERVTVNVANIKSLFVDKIEHRGSKGGISYTYAPTLYLPGAEPATQKLADWSDKLKADEFAEWLRKQIGPDIPATFDEAAAVAVTDEFKATIAPQAPAGELRRDEHSKIQVTDGPDGREFYFPAAQNLGVALTTTLLMLIINGITVVMFHVHAPVLFTMIIGLLGVLFLLGTFNAWFKSSRVTIDSTGVRAINGYLFFSRTRRFNAGDVVRFAAKPGMRSGSQVFLDIKVFTRADGDDFEVEKAKYQQTGQMLPLKFRLGNPGGVTIASGIASAAEANWLVQEMTKALGRSADQ